MPDIFGLPGFQGFRPLAGFGGGGVVPPIDPEEERTLLGDLSENALGGLARIGKLADKLGGRAVRGALGGHYDELASVLPFSDTFGLTDERRAVSGRDLAEQWGLANKRAEGDDSFDSGDVAGMGLEMALDPMTYLTFGAGGAATAAGKVAAKAAGRFRGTTQQAIRGFTARESDINKLAQGLNYTPEAVKRRLGFDTGTHFLPESAEAAARTQNVTLNAAKDIDLNRAFTTGTIDPSLLSDVAGGATPLSGAIGVGLPFGLSEAKPLFTGKAGERIAGLLPYNLAASGLSRGGDAIEQITGFNPTRAAKGLFNTGSKGAYGEVGQGLAEHYLSPLEAQLRREGGEAVAGFAQQMRPFAEAGQDVATAAGRRARLFGEGVQTSAHAQRELPLLEQVLANAGFTPQQIAALDSAATAAGSTQRAARQRLTELGVHSPELVDTADYFLRSRQVVPSPTANPFTFAAERGQAYAARTPSQGRRDDVLRYFPGGTDQFNQLSRDAGLVQQAKAGSPQAARQVFQTLRAGAADTQGLAPIAKKIDAKLTSAAGQKQVQDELSALIGQMTGPPSPQMVQQATDAARQKIADKLTDRMFRKQSRRVADILSTLPDAHVQGGVGYFADDVVGDYRKFWDRLATAEAAAKTGVEGIARSVVRDPITGAMLPHAADGSTMRVDSLLTALNLTGKDAGGRVQTAKRLLAENLGVPMSSLDAAAVPQVVANDLLRFNQRWQNPGELKPALAAWDYLTQMFKTGVTTPFPAFHVRNLIDGFVGQFRGGALSRSAAGEAYNLTRGHPLSAETAAHLFPGMSVADATAAFERELLANPNAYARGSANRDALGGLGETILTNPAAFPSAPSGNSLAGDAVAGAVGAVKGVKDRVANAQGLLGKAWAGAKGLVAEPVAAGAKVGDLAENNVRVGHYLSLRKQGFSPAAAADEVGMIQRDYGDLTNFEKQVMRRLMPFYSYSRRNAAGLLDEFSRTPATLAAGVRLTQAGREPFAFTPPYIAEGASIPLGTNEDGTRRYVSSLGLPFEDETVKMLGNAAGGNFSRAAQGLLGQAQPYIKLPLEYTFGTQLYSGRRLDELRPSDILSRFLPEGVARGVTQVAANTPAARVLSSTDRLLDERKGAATTAVNMLTGARVQDVDTVKQQPVAMRRLLEEELRGRPGIRSADNLFIMKRLIDEGAVPQDVLKLYRSYLDQQKLIEANSQRR